MSSARDAEHSTAALAACIDHTLLRPQATRAQIQAHCAEARQHGFATVCVNPVWVAEAAARLAGSAVRVCTVAGFPLGAGLPEQKAREAAAAIEAGAAEVDMVLQVGWLIAGDELPALRDEIVAVRKALESARGAVPAERRVLKVILETGLLDEGQKRLGAQLAAEAGAHFVKTCTGFSSAGPMGGGATVADVRLLRSVLPAQVQVKASGGIRDLATARALLAAGATRLGCSASVVIVSAQL
ncbi:MAG: deoxyribose-phosphate aldolase [Planctomycetota bacterium]